MATAARSHDPTHVRGRDERPAGAVDRQQSRRGYRQGRADGLRRSLIVGKGKGALSRGLLLWNKKAWQHVGRPAADFRGGPFGSKAARGVLVAASPAGGRSPT